MKKRPSVPDTLSACRYTSVASYQKADVIFHVVSTLEESISDQLLSAANSIAAKRVPPSHSYIGTPISVRIWRFSVKSVDDNGGDYERMTVASYYGTWKSCPCKPSSSTRFPFSIKVETR